MRTESTDDYLKAIYQIQETQHGLPVSTTRLAAHLGVSNASITGMLKKLSSISPKLIDYQPYNGATLTADGLKTALEVIRHHRLIECYLHEKLGYSWDEVHEEAERLEHVISEEMEERLASALGNPSTDPHGDPIPDRNGYLEPVNHYPLTEMDALRPVSIQRIIGQEPAMLRYLSERNLVPAARVEVIEHSPFNGPVSIRLINHPDTTIVLGKEIAEKILVQPLSSPFSEQSYE
jgi:DtxR family Mn-dependent transcriptional regulator